MQVKLCNMPIRLQEYCINQNSSIIINVRLQGGFPRRRFSKGSVSFKDDVEKKEETQNNSDQILNVPSPYIVEQMNQAQGRG